MQEISLYDLIKFYVKKWRLIASLTFVGLLAGLIYNIFIQVPEYKSSTKLLLVSSQTTQTVASQTLINNYIDLIQSRRVLERVAAAQNNSISYDTLIKAVNAVNQKDTAIIDVTVTATNAKQSADIANEITDSFKIAVNDLYQTSGVIVVDPAVEPSAASNVNKPLQLSAATFVGFLLAIVIEFFAFDYRSSHPAVKKAKRSVTAVSASKNVKAIKSAATTMKTSIIARISRLTARKVEPVSKKPTVKKTVPKKLVAKKTTTTAKTVAKKPATKPVIKKKTPADHA